MSPTDCLGLILVQMERLLIAEGWKSKEWPLWWWWLFFFLNILSRYILRKRGQKAGRLSWVEAIMFSSPQATESFLSGADKTGFCHNSDEDKKNFLGQDVSFPILFSLGTKVSLNWGWPELFSALFSEQWTLQGSGNDRGQQSQVIPKSFPHATHCQTRGKWLQGGILLFDIVMACCRPVYLPISCPGSWGEGNASPQGILPPPAYVEQFNSLLPVTGYYSNPVPHHNPV